MIRIWLALLLLVLFSSLFLCTSCSKAGKSKVNELFQDDFRGLTVPELSVIKQSGRTRDFFFVSRNRVWDALIIVAMQDGVIAKAQKSQGVLVFMTPVPFIVLVEKVDDVWDHTKVSVDIMQELLLKGTNRSEENNGESEYQKELAIAIETLMDKISIQVYASDKWDYL